MPLSGPRPRKIGKTGNTGGEKAINSLQLLGPPAAMMPLVGQRQEETGGKVRLNIREG
jgi:hypothetical protein